MSMGNVQYVGRQSAWHQTGTVIGQWFSWIEACKANNGALDFSVFKSQLRDGLGRPVAAWGTFRWDAADRAAGNKEAARFLGVVGQDYAVIPHHDGADLLDALVGAKDGAHYEAAGTLDNGARVWGQIKLGREMTLADGDHVQPYLTFVTSHDGSAAFQIFLSFVRIVCQNTWNAALSSKVSRTLRVKHTSGAKARIADLHATIAGLDAEVADMAKTLEFLATGRMTRESMVSALDRIFPLPKDADGQTKESSTRRDNVLADVLSLYADNDGQAITSQRDSALALFNAITNYTDHKRSTRGTERAVSALFGTGDALKTNALEVLTSMRKSGEIQDAPKSIVVDYAGLGLNIPALTV